MKNIISITLLVICLFFSSCNSSKLISTGGFTDVSLNRSSDEYTLKRLDELEYPGKAFWGIPQKTQNTRGTVLRFNGVDLGRTRQFLPILTLISYNAIATTVLHGHFKKYFSTRPSFDTPLVPSLAISIPVCGFLNNITWSESAVSSASWNVNQNLLLYNPDIDVFLNPKYEIKSKMGFWSQNSTIKANVIGATLKID